MVQLAENVLVTQRFFQLAGMTSLRKVFLQSNRIHDLPESTFTWQRVEQVNLARNLLRRLPEAVRALFVGAMLWS